MSLDAQNLSQQARIDAICGRFEAKWKRGVPPDVESLLECASAADRGPLLRELLRVELAYRRRRGETPAPNDYLSRFPSDAETVQAVFRSSRLNESSGQDTIVPQGAATAIRLRHSATCRFEKRRPHAEGGLGRVAVALDTELQREVAYKEIRPEYAEREESRARFVLEAEITGRLEHPGIVPVYSLGTDEAGRPFYAMRFVQGETLGEAIARFHGVLPTGAVAETATTAPSTEVNQEASWRGAALSVGRSEPAFARSPTRAGLDYGSLEFRKLIERFVSVCQAVAYAHQRGVVHRDLKPANIVFGPFGESLVLDWGLAKLVGDTDSRVPGESIVPQLADSSTTNLGAVIGTPAFMSPEQAAGQTADVTPASDVYGLGAILYALLTNHPPVEADTREALLADVAAGRIHPPRSLEPTIPRALEAVCLKALALRAEDRYVSATALADELDRWLADEPVLACVEPPLARAGRWMRRHRTLVGGTATAIVVLAVTSTVGAALLGAAYRREESLNGKLHASYLAIEQTNRELVDANARETTSRRQAEAVADYLVQAFSKADPNQDGRRLTVAEMLAQAVERLTDDTQLEPLTRATLFDAIGKTYLGLGLPADAVPVFAHAVDLRAEKLGTDDALTLASMNEVGAAYQGQGEPQRAQEQFSAVYLRARTTLGPGHPLTLTAQHNLGTVLRDCGKLEEAIALLDQVRVRRTELLGPDHPETLVATANLAWAYEDQGQLRLAVDLLEHVRDRQDQLRDQPVFVLQSLHNLAGAYFEVSRFDDAIALYRQVLEQENEVLGPAHPGTLATMSGLAAALAAAHRLDEAILLHRQALDRAKAALPADHPQLLVGRQNLAVALASAGRHDEALTLHEEAYLSQRQKFGAEHPTTLAFAYNLGLAYCDASKPELAVPLLREALEQCSQGGGPEHRDSRGISAALGRALLATGEYAAAEPRLRDGLNDFHTLQPDSWECANMKVMLGAALCGQQKFAEAEPLLREGHEGLTSQATQIPPGYRFLLANAVEWLAKLSDDTGRPDEAARWRKVLAEQPARSGASDTN